MMDSFRHCIKSERGKLESDLKLDVHIFYFLLVPIILTKLIYDACKKTTFLLV